MKKLLQLMFGSEFDESVRINVKVPDYFQKLGILMAVAKRKYVYADERMPNLI